MEFYSTPIVALGFMRVSLSPAYSATWKDAHRSLNSLFARPTHRFSTDELSAIAPPETNDKDSTDAHLVRLAERHDLKFATLDMGLIAQNWAKSFVINPISPSV